MNRDELRLGLAEIIENIKKINIDKSTFTEGTYLGGDVGMDSVEILESIVDVQKRFSIQIPKEELGEIYTVKDVIDLAEKFGRPA